ncbi:MAG: hypothetical protein OK455_08795 [Thaumarchaeota archaeon]|nr:hypothetical protein [Nitrososphaerota archaeon]
MAHEASPPAASSKPGELSAQESARRRDAKRLMVLFAVLSLLGIALLLVSVILGLVILVVAEGLFVYAFMRFSKKKAAVPELQSSS